MPGLDAPDDRPFPFVYYITIRNRSAHTVTVRARKWVVRQKNGEVIVVEGDGVIGQFPRLVPGAEFPTIPATPSARTAAPKEPTSFRQTTVKSTRSRSRPSISISRSGSEPPRPHARHRRFRAAGAQLQPLQPARPPALRRRIILTRKTRAVPATTEAAAMLCHSVFMTTGR